MEGIILLTTLNSTRVLLVSIRLEMSNNHIFPVFIIAYPVLRLRISPRVSLAHPHVKLWSCVFSAVHTASPKHAHTFKRDLFVE